MKIEAKYLSQVYRDGNYGLNDFSVTIESGDFVTVLGESGSGKTTLLRVLSGLEKLSSGELYFDGVLSADIPLKQRKTSLVFQEYVLYPRFTVWENLQAALERYDLNPDEENKRIKRALADFDLLDVAGTLPKNLSGGQQQRVALAKAVVTRPELLLFDEPLSNVAEKQRTAYMQIIKDLKKRLPKTTFVYVTHNATESLTLGNKLLVMKEGKAVQYGDTSFVASNPYSLDVLQTVFATEAIDTEIVDGKAKVWDKVIAVEASDQPVKAALNPFTKAYSVFNAQGVNLIGQPQYLDLSAVYDGKTLNACGIEVPVDDNFAYRYVGRLGEVTLRIPTDSISAVKVNNGCALPVVKKSANFYDVCGTTVRLNNIGEVDKYVYFPTDRASCMQDGKTVLAHYRVYLSKCVGRISGNRLRLPCGSMPYEGKNGKVEVTVKRGARANLCQSGLAFDCLSEDDLGQFRFAHCKMKGFDQYVTLNTGKSKLLSDKKSKLVFHIDDIEVKYI